MNEKKRIPVGFWLVAIATIAIIGMAIFEVVRVIRAPLTPAQKSEINVDRRPGVIQKKADRFNDDVNQILRGNIVRHAPERKYSSGSAVTYAPSTAAPENEPEKAGKSADEESGKKTVDPSSYYQTGR
jgi:hypothetical protein